MKKILGLAASAAVLALAGHASAGAEYVNNGGFEDPVGDHLSFWTQVGDWSTGYNYVSTDGHNGSLSELHIGNYVAEGEAGVSQVLDTLAGGTYDVSLWFRNSGDNSTNNGQSLQVLWNDKVVGQLSAQSFTGDYEELIYHVVGLGSDKLTVQGYSSSGYNYVDDISVVDGLPVVSPGVPEPASWALMLTGFVGLGSVLRRRRAGLASVV